MSAKNTAKVRMCLTPSTPSSTLIPTAITSIPAANGKPEGIKVTLSGSGIVPAVGEVVRFKNVGYSNIDNKVYVVTATGTADFSIGNVTLGSGALSVESSVEFVSEADMQCLCLSEFTVSVTAPTVIDTSTYCGSSSIPSAKVEAGTAAAVGYVDITDAGYLAILEACENVTQHVLRVSLGDNGYLVMPVTLSGLSYTLPLDGAQQYSFQFTFGEAPKHLFA